MKLFNFRVGQDGPLRLTLSLGMPQIRESTDYKRLGGLLAIVCCPGVVSGALAAPADSPVNNEEAQDEIVVTASRYAQKITDVPESVSVISAAQIADTPAYTLDDVLRTVPSVNLPFASAQQIHPTSSIVSMRGLSGHRALVLLDGIPINDAFFGYVQWSRVSLASVDRVEVVRGGDSTLWGRPRHGWRHQHPDAGADPRRGSGGYRRRQFRYLSRRPLRCLRGVGGGDIQLGLQLQQVSGIPAIPG
jgi:hypothetical protein